MLKSALDMRESEGKRETNARVRSARYLCFPRGMIAMEYGSLIGQDADWWPPSLQASDKQQINLSVAVQGWQPRKQDANEVRELGDRGWPGAHPAGWHAGGQEEF